VDSLTGKRKEIDFDLNGLARDFVFDQKNELRVVVVTNVDQSQLTVWYRDQAWQAWKKLSGHSSLDPKFTVMAFDADGSTMLVSAPTSEGRKGIYKYDFAANKPGERHSSGKCASSDAHPFHNSLVKQGVLDPKRICIMGASYGGYAVMMGLVKDPDLYRCGVNLFGVTSIPYLFSESRWSKDRVAEFSFTVMVGDPDKLCDQFDATSPSRHADKIKAPVLMLYDEKDTRVPLIHGEAMRDGLKKFGKVVESTELENEEHGISKEETKFNVYGGIKTFLKKYNPPR
jgi:dienelactone hydrolase